MKQFLLLLTIAAGIGLPAYAQTTDTSADPGFATAPGLSAGPGKQKASPAIRAARQLNLLQKKLNLNQDQVVKLRMILLDLNISLDSLHANPSGDRKADNKARRAITQDADVKTYALLTTDQQVAYAQWKQEMQARRKLNRAAQKGAAAPPTPQQN